MRIKSLYLMAMMIFILVLALRLFAQDPNYEDAVKKAIIAAESGHAD